MLIRGHLRFIEETLEADHSLRISLEVIERASRRIEDMARRILDFSKKRSTHLESYDAAELVADSLRFVQPYFKDQSTEVRTLISQGLPRIRVDRWQFIQALVNVLQNGADSMSHTEPRTLTLAVNRIDNDILISVADSGQGIPIEDLHYIFTPFFTTKNEKSNGLGLFIARRIIEEHRGTITVQSGSGGTTFTISLPLQMRDLART